MNYLYDWLDEALLNLSPPKDISFVEFAEKNINLPELTCPEPGPFRTKRTPYIIGPMQAFQASFIEELNLLFGRQLAKSTFIYNCLCYVVGCRPGPGLMLFPDRDLAKYTSKNRLQEQFNGTPAVMKQRTKDEDDYGLFEMRFKNMVLNLGWAGSGSQVMSKPVQYLFFDEIDEFKSMVGKGVSNPVTSAEQTTSNFPHRKIVKDSTPSEEDNFIWQAIAATKYIFEYWLRCPHCGMRQVLIWPQIKKPKDVRDPEKVCLVTRYECIHCKEYFTNSEKINMLQAEGWRARIREFVDGKNPTVDEIMGDKIVPISDTVSLEEFLENKLSNRISFHLPKWYSPFENATFGHAFKEFLEAQNDFTKKRDWTKFWAAKPYVERAKTAEYVELLENKIDLNPSVCPANTHTIITTVDPGQGGFWYIVCAWQIIQGVSTCHIMLYGFLPYWPDVTTLCFDNVYKVDGSEYDTRRSWRFGLDTGGSKYDEDLTMTEAAYIWLRQNARQNVFGVKGKSQTKSSKRVTLSIIDKMPGQQAEIIPGGLALWIIDTEAFKDAIQFYLTRGPGQPGRITFHNEVKDDLIAHLLSEKKERNKKGILEWKRKGPNHWLDCLVYNFGLADQECQGGIKVLRPPNPHAQVAQKRKEEPEQSDWLRGIENL